MWGHSPTLLSFITQVIWWELYWYVSALDLVVWGRSGVECRFRWDKALVPHLNLHMQTLQTLEPLQSPIYHLWAPSFPKNSSCKNMGIQKWTELPGKDASLECGWYSGTQIPLAPAVHHHFMNHTDADKLRHRAREMHKVMEGRGDGAVCQWYKTWATALTPKQTSSPLCTSPALPYKSQCDSTTGHPCNVC